MKRPAPILIGLAMLSAAPAPAEDVAMAWQESGFQHSLYVDLENQEVAFKKEPAYAGEQVLRAALPFGAARAEQLPFALDWTGKKLRLDANYNLDLTDDPVLDADASISDRLIFKGVELEAAGPPARRYRADLEFPPGGSFMLANLRSGWVGTWLRGTSTWRVVFVDDLDGAWDEDDLFAMAADSAEFQKDPRAFALEPVQGLFIDGVHSEIRLAPAADGTWLFSMRETAVPMGRLRVAGDMVERLVLQGGAKGRKAILNKPGPDPVTVPAGTYPVQDITLATSIGRLTSSRPADLVVRAGEETELKVGAPLRSRGTAHRDRGEIEVQYELQGVGGEAYRLPADRRTDENRPRVEIFKGGRRVARGAFEFG
ncbi:MAG TPA: hypothetical protein P5567_07045 [Kiritimatiellia bacterium]|nr:hypothetical protein [Kiritimatiellia bacterium]HRZ12195.1 hypothetical protein [Kiritimatiellia bacterium]HSA18047.1 hypothetical protein [Kiritimatiellia bacterium]